MIDEDENSTDVPTLHAIIKTGDQSIIESTRGDLTGVVSVDDQVEILSEASDTVSPTLTSPAPAPESIEQMVANLVQKHTIRLEQDIRELVIQALNER